MRQMLAAIRSLVFSATKLGSTISPVEVASFFVIMMYNGRSLLNLTMLKNIIISVI